MVLPEEATVLYIVCACNLPNRTAYFRVLAMSSHACAQDARTSIGSYVGLDLEVVWLLDLIYKENSNS